MLLVVGFVATIAGAVALWPSGDADTSAYQDAVGGAGVTESGAVTAHSIGPCGSPSAGRAFTGAPLPPPAQSYECDRSLVTIESGPNEGAQTLLEIVRGPGQPQLQPGDSIRLLRQDDTTGQTQYSFEDYSRGLPLALLAAAFAIVVVVIARGRGLRALIGIAVAFGVLIVFTLPAVLDGRPAVPVALVTGSVILYAVLYLAHGFSLRTSSALLGTLTSMVLAAVLSWVAIEATTLTGLSEEQNTNVQTYLAQVSLSGLLLAGFIIGSLGVLNDVTITQASSAFELAALDESAGPGAIFRSAMRVGRDHIASTVYTLVLAYAGGALPLLLLFSVTGRPFLDVLTSDAVAIEIARSAVGGIALALSVPLTTAIAAILARPPGSAGAERPRGRHAKA